MRTKIEIGEKLMHQAMRSSGTRTKKAAVETALRLLVKLHAQTSLRELRGTIDWAGDLEESRAGHVQK